MKEENTQGLRKVRNQWEYLEQVRSDMQNLQKPGTADEKRRRAYGGNV